MADADVIVVGGGIIGVSCAYHLAAAGVSVLLLERDGLGSGSTAKAAGGVRSAFTSRVNVEMGLRGLSEYAGFAARFGQEIDFERIGYLFLITDPADVPSFQHCADLQHEYGVRSRLISPEEAREVSPLIETDGLVGALWSPDDAKATPDSVVQGYAAAARRCGAVLRTGVEVTGVEVVDGRVAGVRTGHGVIGASSVVIAAGAWSRGLAATAGLDLPVTPSRRQVIFTGPMELGPTPLTIEMPSTLYFHREGQGLAVGFSDPAQEPGFDTTFEPDGWLEQVFPLIERRAPRILDAGVKTGWAGLYEVTPDHNQLVGTSTEVAGLLYATGFSGHGFQMGPAVGETIRDLYLGVDPAIDVSSLDAGRFAGGAAVHEHNIV